MIIKHNRKVLANKRSNSKTSYVRASHTTSEMLDAFEDKLAEFGIESSTDVTAGSDLDSIRSNQRAVEIYGEDYQTKFEDLDGCFGEAGDIVSLAEIKEYWHENSLYNPIPAAYSDFDSWFEDTFNNCLSEYHY